MSDSPKDTDVDNSFRSGNAADPVQVSHMLDQVIHDTRQSRVATVIAGQPRLVSARHGADTALHAFGQ